MARLNTTSFQSGNMSASTSTERERLVWEAFRKGDRNAFASLMNDYYPLLLNYGSQFQKDREFVKDCLHDLFVDLWNRRQKLEGVEKLTPYLLISLRHRLFRESRRLRWFREAEEVNEEYAFEVQFAIESYLVNNEVQHEDLKRLQFNLEKLPKRQREAIYLRFFQESGKALQGRVPGLTFTNVSSPGTAPNIRIKGVSSVSFSTDSLYLVDGFPTTNLSSFDNNDVESVEILKDACAAAIYGSRATNVLILITTKKGHKGKKLSINLDTYAGVESAWRLLDPMNTDQHTAFMNSMYSGANNENAGARPSRYTPYRNG